MLQRNNGFSSRALMYAVREGQKKLAKMIHDRKHFNRKASFTTTEEWADYRKKNGQYTSSYYRGPSWCYRVRHIAYCRLRGTPMNKIETNSNSEMDKALQLDIHVNELMDLWSTGKVLGHDARETNFIDKRMNLYDNENVRGNPERYRDEPDRAGVSRRFSILDRLFGSKGVEKRDDCSVASQ